MILSHGAVQLVPFWEDAWTHFATWFYSGDYEDMFRHTPQPLTETQFRNYPTVLGANIYMVVRAEDKEVIGYCFFAPCTKTNQGFKLGILIDKKFQKCSFATSAVYSLLDLGFNRLGYRKAIMDILVTRTDMAKRLLSSGFKKEGILIQEAFLDGEYVDEMRICTFASNFNKQVKGKI